MPIINDQNDFLLHEVYTTTERYNFEPITLQPYTLPDVDFDEVKGMIISGIILRKSFDKHDYPKYRHYY